VLEVEDYRRKGQQVHYVANSEVCPILTLFDAVFLGLAILFLLAGDTFNAFVKVVLVWGALAGVGTFY